MRSILNVNSSSVFGRFGCRKSHVSVERAHNGILNRSCEVRSQGSLLSPALALIPLLKKASFSGVAGSFVGLKMVMFSSVSFRAKTASVLCHIP